MGGHPLSLVQSRWFPAIRPTLLEPRFPWLKMSEGFYPSGNNSHNRHQTHVQWRAGQTKDLVERRKSSRGTGTGEGWGQSLCKSCQSRRKDIAPSIIGRVPVKAPRVAASRECRPCSWKRVRGWTVKISISSRLVQTVSSHLPFVVIVHLLVSCGHNKYLRRSY